MRSAVPSGEGITDVSPAERRRLQHLNDRIVQVLDLLSLRRPSQQRWAGPSAFVNGERAGPSSVYGDLAPAVGAALLSGPHAWGMGGGRERW